MTYILEGRLKGAVEEANKERALKEVSKSTLREQIVDLVAAERRFIKAGRAYAAVEKRVAYLEGKLGEAKVKLAQAESDILVREKEITDLKAAMTQSEEKFYNMGFIDVENSN
nr:hypothetical protein CFP56_65271 [Quercus suber]